MDKENLIQAIKSQMLKEGQVTQYIGARYVPKFAEPYDWDVNSEYEPLTIVFYGGDSYTSRQFVPTGIDIKNSDFWTVTGNFNAQIEQYRTEVRDLSKLVDERLTDLSGIETSINEITADVTELTASTNTATADITQLKTDLSSTNTKVSKNTTDISTLKTDLNTQLDKIKSEVKSGNKYETMACIGDSWGVGYYDGSNHPSEGWAVKLRDLFGITASNFHNACVSGAGIEGNNDSTFAVQCDKIKNTLGEPDLLVIMGGQNDRSHVGTSGLDAFKTNVTAFMNKLSSTFPNSEIHMFACPLGYNHKDAGSVASPYISIIGELVRIGQLPNVTVHQGCVSWGNWVGQVNADGDSRHLLPKGYTLVANLMHTMITQGQGDFWDADSDTIRLESTITVGSPNMRCFTQNGIVNINFQGSNQGAEIKTTTANPILLGTLPPPFHSLQKRFATIVPRAGSEVGSAQFRLQENTIELVSGTIPANALFALEFTYPYAS